MAELIALTEDCHLAPLAEKINAATNSAEAGARTAMSCALEAGTLLAEAKALVHHGEWESWLIQNCDVAPRTAQAYMRLAKAVPMLDGAKAQRVADLPVREAIRAIATNPTQPTRYADIQLHRRDDADRAVAALRKSASALRAASRNIECLRTLKGSQVASLRKKLTDALAAIDRIEQVEVNHDPD